MGPCLASLRTMSPNFKIRSPGCNAHSACARRADNVLQVSINLKTHHSGTRGLIQHTWLSSCGNIFKVIVRTRRSVWYRKAVITTTAKTEPENNDVGNLLDNTSIFRTKHFYFRGGLGRGRRVRGAGRWTSETSARDSQGLSCFSSPQRWCSSNVHHWS